MKSCTEAWNGTRNVRQRRSVNDCLTSKSTRRKRQPTRRYNLQQQQPPLAPRCPPPPQHLHHHDSLPYSAALRWPSSYFCTFSSNRSNATSSLAHTSPYQYIYSEFRTMKSHTNHHRLHTPLLASSLLSYCNAFRLPLPHNLSSAHHLFYRLQFNKLQFNKLYHGYHQQGLPRHFCRSLPPRLSPSTANSLAMPSSKDTSAALST